MMLAAQREQIPICCNRRAPHDVLLSGMQGPRAHMAPPRWTACPRRVLHSLPHSRPVQSSGRGCLKVGSAHLRQDSLALDPTIEPHLTYCGRECR